MLSAILAQHEVNEARAESEWERAVAEVHENDDNTRAWMKKVAERVAAVQAKAAELALEVKGILDDMVTVQEEIKHEVRFVEIEHGYMQGDLDGEVECDLDSEAETLKSVLRRLEGDSEEPSIVGELRDMVHEYGNKPHTGWIA